MVVSMLCSDSVIRTFDQNGYANNIHYFNYFGFNAKVPHNDTQCEGKCAQHPLMRPEYLLSWDEMNEREFELIEASLTASDKAKRAAEAEAAKAMQKLDAEAIKMELYAREMKEKAQMGLKRGDKPKKIQQPCKWVVGQFLGEECWAWEYTDPKTGKRECPRTCQRLHKGEEGWHDEWLKNPRWEPAGAQVRRFDGMVGKRSF
jgi:hypothetical protein